MNMKNDATNINTVTNTSEPKMNYDTHVPALLFLLIDACILVASYLLAYYLRFYSFLATNFHGEIPPLRYYAEFLIYVLPCFLLLNYIFQLYSNIRKKGIIRELLGIVLSNLCGIVFFMSILFLRQEYHISRTFIIVFFLINIILSITLRTILPKLVKFTKAC